MATKESVFGKIDAIGSVEAKRRIEDFLRGDGSGETPRDSNKRPLVDLSGLPHASRTVEIARINAASKRAGFLPVMVSL